MLIAGKGIPTPIHHIMTNSDDKFTCSNLQLSVPFHHERLLKEPKSLYGHGKLDFWHYLCLELDLGELRTLSYTVDLLTRFPRFLRGRSWEFPLQIEGMGIWPASKFLHKIPDMSKEFPD
jgi:hypothetical protein